MVVKFMEKEQQCTNAVRGENWLRLMVGNVETTKFEGISDWSVFEFIGGEPEHEIVSVGERINALESALLCLLGGENNV